ncbi:hypothetical protein [Neisseria chenwenguii]|uniref:hypothetical protein n=1 Tax=Neisseria chenwenguii TaxID=1853278 RepID=UPI0012FE7AA0|nr:hypothetical protein [Neisseria chenwenguii]
MQKSEWLSDASIPLNARTFSDVIPACAGTTSVERFGVSDGIIIRTITLCSGKANRTYVGCPQSISLYTSENPEKEAKKCL